VNTNDPVQPRFEIPVNFNVVPSDRIFATGFEAGEGESLLLDPNLAKTERNAGTNPHWVGSDSRAGGNGTPFYPASAFDSSLRVRDGAAWLGGWGASSGTQSFSQQATLTKGRAQLSYRRNALVAASGTATLNVYVDSQLVTSTDLVANGVDAGWTRQSVDLTRYADDREHVIRFEYVSFGGSDGSVLINGLTLDSTQHGLTRYSRAASPMCSAGGRGLTDEASFELDAFAMLRSAATAA
jgi:hypothetical protein